MKKWIYIVFTLCLALALAACGGSGTAEPQVGNGIVSDHMHCVCVGNALGVGEHKTCSDKDGWVEISTAKELTDAVAAAQKPAYLCLTADIEVDGYLEVAEGAEVYICLGGKTLTAAVSNIGKLHITDCADTGVWTSRKSFTVRNYPGAVASVFGGTITTTGSASDTQIVILDGAANEELQLSESESVFMLYNGKIQAVGKTTMQGHCVNLNKFGIFKMYNGTVCDGYVETTDSSARFAGNVAVFGNNSAFYMYGGEVKNGKVVQPQGTGINGGCGGNIALARGRLYIYGGTVSGGYANGYGGNIGTNNKPGMIEIKNCVIKDGVCDGINGGNIFINDSNGTETAVFENATISGGRSAENGGNVFINSATVITFKDCAITGGESPNGGGIGIQGKEFLVVLKGNMKFENNQRSDIYMKRYYDTQSALSVAELTSTTPIVVQSSSRTEFTVDTVLNHPFVAVDGMKITEEGGKLVIDKKR